MTEKLSSTRWFGMALQALVVLSDYEGLCPSGKIAEKVDSESGFMRKILTHLVKAGLIQAKEGRDGGYCLIKAPKDITLLEIYYAINAEPFTKDLLCIENKGCITPATKQALFQLRDEMEGWLVEGLKQKTLADLLKE